MGNYTIFRCSKILGEAGKQNILQQMFRKFWISNRLPNRYFPKIDVGCPCLGWQNNNFNCTCITLFVTADDYDVKLPNFILYGGR